MLIPTRGRISRWISGRKCSKTLKLVKYYICIMCIYFYLYFALDLFNLYSDKVDKVNIGYHLSLSV